MATYKSGISYDKLREAASADALSTLGKGTYRKNGKKYQGKVSYVDNRGDKPRRVYLTCTFADTQTSGRAATGKKKLDELLGQWIANLKEDIRSVGGLDSDPTMSVAKAVEWFISSKEKHDDDGNMIGARYSTIAFYRSCAKRIGAVPSLAAKQIGDVTTSDVKQLVNVLSLSKSKKTISDTLFILESTCAAILKDRPNPCKGVKIPKNTRDGRKNAGRNTGKPNSLSADGVLRLNTCLDKRESTYKGIDLMSIGVRIALNTGMRAEEVSGLRWRDVDFGIGEIYVCNVIERAYVQRLDDEGNPMYDDNGNAIAEYKEFDSRPKTVESERPIPMNAELTRILREHKSRVSSILKEKFDDDTRPNINDLYVIGHLDGTHYSPHRLGANFKKFCKKYRICGTRGVEIGFHCLRDTFATLGLAHRPERLSEISTLLGHSDINTTLARYIGTDKEEQRRFVKDMGESLSARLPQGVETLGDGTNG